MNSIKEYRLKKGLTQAEFAAKVGTVRMSVIRWEKGEIPGERNLFKLAELIGVDYYDLKAEFQKERDN